MFWNNKKKTKSIPIPVTKECTHAWKDFPWYATVIYSPSTYSGEIHIKEPYICIYCGQRKDVTLQSIYKTNVGYNKFSQMVDAVYEKYAEQLKSTAVVEDMINDFQLVDRKTLYFYEMLHNGPKKDELK